MSDTPVPSALKRPASQLSEDPPGDRGHEADDPATARSTAASARSSKAQKKTPVGAHHLSTNYKSRDDIVVTPAEMEEKCSTTGSATSRLKSVCGVETKRLPLKTLRVIFTKEGMAAFASKSKRRSATLSLGSS